MNATGKARDNTERELIYQQLCKIENIKLDKYISRTREVKRWQLFASLAEYLV